MQTNQQIFLCFHGQYAILKGYTQVQLLSHQCPIPPCNLKWYIPKTMLPPHLLLEITKPQSKSYFKSLFPCVKL